LDKARVQDQVKNSDMMEMLRTRLWNGLNDNLKTRKGYLFETIKSYDTLRVSLRRAEYDMNMSLKANEPHKANVRMNVTKTDNPVSDKQLHSAIGNLTSSVETLKNEVQELKRAGTNELQGNFSGNLTSNNTYRCQNASDKHMNFPVTNNYEFYPTGRDQSDNVGQRNRGRDGFSSGRGYSNYNTGCKPDTPWSTYTNQQNQFSDQNQFYDQISGHNDKYSRSNPEHEPQCWRCGQLGHLRSGCRVILNKTVNYKMSTTQGSR
jgi:hypothetical protein